MIALALLGCSHCNPVLSISNRYQYGDQNSCSDFRSSQKLPNQNHSRLFELSIEKWTRPCEEIYDFKKKKMFHHPSFMRNIRSNANGGARNILNWEEIEHFFFFALTVDRFQIHQMRRIFGRRVGNNQWPFFEFLKKIFIAGSSSAWIR